MSTLGVLTSSYGRYKSPVRSGYALWARRFGCAGSQNSSVLRFPSAISLHRVTVLDGGALSLWCRAHFGTWRSLFVAGARETSGFGGLKSTFCERFRRSEQFDVDVQILWQAQYFGHGGLRHVLISWQAQYFVDLEVQISWQAPYFVDLEVRISWQAQYLKCRFCDRCSTLWTLKRRFPWQVQYFVDLSFPACEPRSTTTTTTTTIFTFITTNTSRPQTQCLGSLAGIIFRDLSGTHCDAMGFEGYNPNATHNIRQ